ncbi:adhesion G protein-coupled receptor L3-like [Brachyhypopomus gauderio]|uniref:adhesion G protein-coupled receptor L3-like n=1 Tax=Brachyhypopomus gauderio TaxID=698409 RepID=UPI0040427F47
MPQNVMVNILATIHNNTYLLNGFESTAQSTMANYGNSILKATEKLVSIMVNNVKMDSTSINLPNLDIGIFKVGPNTTLTKIPQIKTSTAFLDIDLIAISKHNNGSTAVVFMTYSNMLNMLKPDTNTNAVKTMMSIVVTVMVLPISNNPSTVNHNPSPSRDIDYPHTSQTTDDPKMPLQVPYNVTLNNPDKYHQHYDASCVTWSGTKWVNGFCHVTWKNDSYTVCSCVHPETLALLMQIEDSVSDPTLELLDIIAESVGLVFLSLALLTFALCRRNTRLTNTAQINLCLSLLLAHLLFLLTQQFLQYIQPIQLACVTLAGVLLFLFLSAFVWMFIEAVLLFIAVRNLSNIRSKQKEVLSWKWLIIIGYVIPLVIVSVSAGLFPDGFGSDNCWLKKDEQFFWSFLGPVCFILTVYAEFQRITNQNLPNKFYAQLDHYTPRLMTMFRQKASKTGRVSDALVDILKAHDEQVYAEFQRITNQNLPNKFYAQLDHYTPRLMTMFRQKASKTGRVSDALVDILKAHDEQELHDVHTRRTTVLRALPVLLREDVLGFYKTSMDDPNEIELGDVPVALFVTGSENVDDPVHYHPVKVSIVLDSDVATKFCRLADAFLVLFGLIYGLHLNYPKGLTSTFEFVQKILLGLEDGKLSPKLQTIKNDLMV